MSVATVSLLFSAHRVIETTLPPSLEENRIITVITIIKSKAVTKAGFLYNLLFIIKRRTILFLKFIAAPICVIIFFCVLTMQV